MGMLTFAPAVEKNSSIKSRKNFLMQFLRKCLTGVRRYNVTGGFVVRMASRVIAFKIMINN